MSQWLVLAIEHRHNMFVLAMTRNNQAPKESLWLWAPERQKDLGSWKRSSTEKK